MLYFENKAREKGFEIIVGIDEAGRGPLAGPVVACAVALQKEIFQNKIADSKTITSQVRERAFYEIFDNAFVGIGVVNEHIIDRINILCATHVAMSMAVERLIAKMRKSASFQSGFENKICLLVDGNSFKTDLPYAFETIVNGDALSLSIACASIVAKVTRDRMLNIYDKVFPQYGFCRHKGYPTAAHRIAIRDHGLSPIHRRTFHHS